MKSKLEILEDLINFSKTMKRNTRFLIRLTISNNFITFDIRKWNNKSTII
jgi:hypothetical protein